jgi:hypothetical protein
VAEAHEQLVVADDPMPRPERCIATARTGQRCGQPAMVNQRVCRYHGGSAPQSLRAAARRAREAEARKVLAMRGVREIRDPYDALTKLASQAVAFSDLCSEALEEGYGDPVEVASWLALASRITGDLCKLGVPEKRRQLAERDGELLERVVRVVASVAAKDGEDAGIKAGAEAMREIGAVLEERGALGS